MFNVRHPNGAKVKHINDGSDDLTQLDESLRNAMYTDVGVVVGGIDNENMVEYTVPGLECGHRTVVGLSSSWELVGHRKQLNNVVEIS
jgi:hypothetical protein